MRKVFFASLCGFVGIVLLFLSATVAGGVIVETGFNDSRGLHADELAGFPYSLNETAIGQGEAEPGWTSPWEGSASMATVQDLVTFEGDGALLIDVREPHEILLLHGSTLRGCRHDSRDQSSSLSQIICVTDH